GVNGGVSLAWRLEGLQQVLPDEAGEAAADLAGESQFVAFVDADRKSTEVAGIATPRGPATDHELLLRPDLDLEPCPGTATRLVPRTPQLRDHALDPDRAGGIEERLPLPDDMRREANPRMVLEHAAEQALAVLERDVEQRSPIEIHQVEDLVDDPGRLLVTEFRLEEAEIGLPVVVEGELLATHCR